MRAERLHMIAPGVHVAEAPQRFFGLEVGARMTVLETAQGLLIHSPIDVAAEQIGELGEPRWVLAPNLLHHLYVGRWLAAGVEGWAGVGLAEKRADLRFTGVIDGEAAPFGDEIGVFPMRCFPMANEVVILHRPSRTLIVTDLVFNFTAQAPWWTRAVMTCLGGYPGCSTTVIERIGFDRALARVEVGRLLSLDFDRLVMSHGAVIETGGKAALAGALGWLDR